MHILRWCKRKWAVLRTGTMSVCMCVCGSVLADFFRVSQSPGACCHERQTSSLLLAKTSPKMSQCAAYKLQSRLWIVMVSGETSVVVFSPSYESIPPVKFATIWTNCVPNWFSCIASGLSNCGIPQIQPTCSSLLSRKKKLLTQINVTLDIIWNKKQR